MVGDLRRQLDWLFGSDPFIDARLDRVSSVPRFVARRTDEGLEVQADLPGLKREDLKVRVEDGVVHISGERRANAPEGYKALRTERVHGRFERAFTLPEDVNPEGAEAKLTDGVLTLRFPLRPEKQPKSIDVQVA
jgi:HSP20 family protein